MLGQQFRKPLRLIASRLAGQPVNWALTGSASFALQGMDLQVHDLDLQSDANGAYEIERLMLEYRAEPVAYRVSERIRSHFGALEIDGVRVEIMGGLQKLLEDGRWEEPVDPARHRLFVPLEGLQIPVLSLDYEAQAYSRMGRLERAAQIRAFLNRPGR